MKIGADPEFEFFKGKNFVPAYQILGNRLKAKLGVDGDHRTGEIRPHPSDPGGVMRSISAILTRASKLHCEIYAGSGKTVPLGGHIHFSGVKDTPKLVEKLDKFITIPLNKVSDTQIRRGRFGTLSEVRSQPHGWEYRSPCSWIAHPIIAFGVLRIAWLLAKAQCEGKLNKLNSYDDIIEYGRTDTHPNRACQDIMQFLKMLNSMTLDNVKLEHIEIVQAWKKDRDPIKPRVRVSGSTIPVLRWSNDEMLSLVREHYQQLSHNYYHDNRRFNIVGASQSRTNAETIFVPQKYNAQEHFLPFDRWDNSAIGLSWSLRQNPESAARMLFTLLLRNGDTTCAV